MFLPIGDNVNRRDLPVVPVLLVLINVLVFAWEIRISQDGDPKAFFRTWGLVPSDLRNGEVMGVLSHMFLHGSFMHILVNMMFLWTFACSLEASLGRSILVAFYIVYGIVGGLAHAMSDWSSGLPLVGASGAVAGLMGAYLMLFGIWTRINVLLFVGFALYRISVPSWVFCLGWFGLQLWSAQMDPGGMAGVAWYAHIAGFVAGLLSIVLFGHVREKDVELDRFGDLRMVDNSTQGYPRPSDWTEKEPTGPSGPVTLPLPCPHCGSLLEQKHLLAENLLQCDAANCGRMIYLEHGIQTSTAAPVG